MLGLKLRAHLGAAGAEVGQEEIGGAGPGLHVEFVEFSFEPGARAEDVFDVALHGLRIANGGFGGGERGDVDGKGRGSAAKNVERIRVGDDGAKAQAGEAGSFGERAGHEEVRILPDERDDRDARKFGVGFVENDGGVRRGLQDFFDGIRCDERAGGIVGIADEKDARLRG